MKKSVLQEGEQLTFRLGDRVVKPSDKVKAGDCSDTHKTGAPLARVVAAQVVRKTIVFQYITGAGKAIKQAIDVDADVPIKAAFAEFRSGEASKMGKNWKFSFDGEDIPESESWASLAARGFLDADEEPSSGFIFDAKFTA